MLLSLSVIILTFNEEKNIEKCLESVSKVADEIIIIDSFSTDTTIGIVSKYTNKIYKHKFENYSKQFNWALANASINSEWVMRLDADERLEQALVEELQRKLNDFSGDVKGLSVKRKVYFMDKWIKYGGYYPFWLLRIWRKNGAICEERWMDEHMVLTEPGKIVKLDNDIVDDNCKNLTWWIDKHNSYSTREAIDMLNIKYNFLKDSTSPANVTEVQAQRKRWVKESVYSKLPYFFRVFMYFIYRYFYCLGFLDGKEGLIRHVLQGFWYRFLVDSKIVEVEKLLAREKISVVEAIKKLYAVDLENTIVGNSEK